MSLSHTGVGKALRVDAAAPVDHVSTAEVRASLSEAPWSSLEVICTRPSVFVPKRDASSVCFLVCLKVFEEQLVLSLDDDDNDEDFPSSSFGKSSLSLCRSPSTIWQTQEQLSKNTVPF